MIKGPGAGGGGGREGGGRGNEKKSGGGGSYGTPTGKGGKKGKFVPIDPSLLGFQTNVVSGPNQYVSEHRIVDRCTGEATLTVDGRRLLTTERLTSGTRARHPGMNWTGVLPDVRTRRFGETVEDEEMRNRLTTCVEGKCIYAIMDSGRVGLKRNYFDRGQHHVLIEINISFDAPCRMCQRAIQYWVDSWKRCCASLKVEVAGLVFE